MANLWRGSRETLQCKVKHFRAMIYCLEGFHVPRGHALPPSYSNLQSALCYIHSLRSVSALGCFTARDTSPKLNSTKPRAIPRLIINLLEHLGPGLPAGQAALSRPFPAGLGATAGRDGASRQGCCEQAGSVGLEEGLTARTCSVPCHLHLAPESAQAR